jgi:hypothetical protein
MQLGPGCLRQQGDRLGEVDQGADLGVGRDAIVDRTPEHGKMTNTDTG